MITDEQAIALLAAVNVAPNHRNGGDVYSDTQINDAKLALEAYEQSKRQPIESAPKDGTNILGYRPAEAFEAITVEQTVALLAHKLGKQDKMLALVEVKNCEFANEKLMLVNDFSVFSKHSTLIVYNGGGE
jgi:hypothetical protein